MVRDRPGLPEVYRLATRLDRRGGIERPDFDPREHEADYYERLAKHAAGRALLDVSFANFEDEAGKVEICDVFMIEREFVHVKRDVEAGALSHLFAKGAVSADPFVVERRVTLWVGRMLGTIARALVAVLADVPGDQPLGQACP